MKIIYEILIINLLYVLYIFTYLQYHRCDVLDFKTQPLMMVSWVQFFVTGIFTASCLRRESGIYHRFTFHC